MPLSDTTEFARFRETKVMPSNTAFMQQIEADWMLVGIFAAFILLVSLGILNIIVGIVCKVVVSVSDVEREALAPLTLYFILYF